MTQSPQHLVLVPGLNNTRAVFAGVRDALPAGIQPHALDNPALDSVEAIAAAHLPLLPDRFWLAGFSFGGYVALALLALAPERVKGIALLCSSPFADSPEAAAKRLTALDAVAQGRYLELIDAQAANAFHPDSLGNTALMQARRAMVRDYGAVRYAAHVRATAARADRATLLDGRRPTLVVAASHDKVFPPEQVARYAHAIAGARVETIAGAGHLAPMEKPEAVALVLAKWIETEGATACA